MNCEFNPWYQKSGQKGDFQGTLRSSPPIFRVLLCLWSTQPSSERVIKETNGKMETRKMKKLCPVEFSRKSFKSRKSMKFIKEIFGGQVLKRPAFGLRCADFAQIFFKSHVITKYEKSRRFGVPFVFEKLSNRASKKVWVLRTPPPG